MLCNYLQNVAAITYIFVLQLSTFLFYNKQSKRKEIYEAAKAEHPERWNGRATRDWSLPNTVYLNPDKVHEQSEKADEQMAVS